MRFGSASPLIETVVRDLRVVESEGFSGDAMPNSTGRNGAETMNATLSVNERLFLDEYFSNGRNGTDAYRKHHPNSKYTTAASAACELLKKPKIKEEIERRLNSEPYTKASALDDLEWCVRTAKSHGDVGEVVESVLAHSKLAGWLIDKQEVKYLDEANKEQIRRFVVEQLQVSN